MTIVEPPRSIVWPACSAGSSVAVGRGVAVTVDVGGKRVAVGDDVAVVNDAGGTALDNGTLSGVAVAVDTSEGTDMGDTVTVGTNVAVPLGDCVVDSVSNATGVGAPIAEVPETSPQPVRKHVPASASVAGKFRSMATIISSRNVFCCAVRPNSCYSHPTFIMLAMRRATLKCNCIIAGTGAQSPSARTSLSTPTGEVCSRCTNCSSFRSCCC